MQSNLSQNMAPRQAAAVVGSPLAKDLPPLPSSGPAWTKLISEQPELSALVARADQLNGNDYSPGRQEFIAALKQINKAGFRSPYYFAMGY